MSIDSGSELGVKPDSGNAQKLILDGCRAPGRTAAADPRQSDRPASLALSSQSGCARSSLRASSDGSGHVSCPRRRAAYVRPSGGVARPRAKSAKVVPAAVRLLSCELSLRSGQPSTGVHSIDQAIRLGNDRSLANPVPNTLPGIAGEHSESPHLDVGCPDKDRAVSTVHSFDAGCARSPALRGPGVTVGSRSGCAGSSASAWRGGGDPAWLAGSCVPLVVSTTIARLPGRAAAGATRGSAQGD